MNGYSSSGAYGAYGSAGSGSGAHSNSGNQQMSSDEQIARQLQAQFAAEAQMQFTPQHQAIQKPQYSFPGPQSLSGHMGYTPGMAYSPHTRSITGSSRGSFVFPQPPSEQPSRLNGNMNSNSSNALDTLDPTNPLHQRDFSADEQAIQAFAHQMLQARCFNCGYSLLPNSEAITKIFHVYTSQVPEEEAASPVAQCMCGNSTCVGCGAESADSRKCSTSCARGAIFVIWVLLCGADVFYSRETADAKKRAEKNKSAPKDRENGGGTGYGGSTSFPSVSNIMSAMGFETRYLGQAGDALTKGEQQERKVDDFTTTVVCKINQTIEACGTSLGSNEISMDLLVALLLRSQILEVIAALLRNDSVDDIVKRRKLYSTVFNLTRILSMHPITLPATIYQRAMYANAPNLKEISFRQAASSDQTCAKLDVRPSLLKSVQNIAVQCAALRKNAENIHGPDSSGMIVMYDAIVKIAALLKDGESRVGKQAGQVQYFANTSKTEEEWHREHCVDDVADNILFTNNIYGAKAQAMQSDTKGRMKKLMVDIATMKTSLPQGIFVRHCITRPDVMRVLIIGPRDTPYANGAFEFDLFCGPNFPNTPPEMMFRGANGHCINPNLYGDGKVCLSLLGTWIGDPWQPGKSTLYQVLVSIQSMIFCEEPWYNEPGRENCEAQAAKFGLGVKAFAKMQSRVSRMYNVKVRRQTVQLGMLNHLKQQNPVFKNVLDHHWKTNAGSIVKMVRRWAQEDSGSDTQDFLGSASKLPPSGLSADILPGGFIGGMSNIGSMLPELETCLAGHMQ